MFKLLTFLGFYTLVLATYAYPIWRDCFQGNEGIYRSGVVYPNGIKICMCNNNSQGSC